MGIEYFVLDCAEEYKKIVLQNFKHEYKEGKTPNPCVWCNTTIKFDALPRAAKKQGIVFDKFATGHYARVEYNNELKRFQLKKARDEKKDQSYFLYRLKQEQLQNILMPMGEYTKNEDRDIARKANLDPIHELAMSLEKMYDLHQIQNEV